MILDVGCGAGRFETSCTRRGQINIDIRKPRERPSNFILCDCHNLPFRSRVFEKVFMIDVLEHLTAPPLALKELGRVCQKRGIIVLGTPNALYLPKILRSMKSGIYSVDCDHIATYGKTELRNLLRRVGFQKFKVEARTYRDLSKNWLWRLILMFFRSDLRHVQIVVEIEN